MVRGDLGGQRVAVQIRYVAERARLLGDRVGDRGVGMAERDDRQAGDEVEVPVPSASKSTVPSPADEGGRRVGVGAHEGAALGRHAVHGPPVSGPVTAAPWSRRPSS